MIRKYFLAKKTGRPQPEPKRNCEIQRIETFSDAVFGFAVTLLIVSLEVPKNFEELLVNMRGFFAFGISFLILIFIWYEQHNFFRNYGLSDRLTLSLNIALLFITLFYVYPLKFLFTLLFSSQIYPDRQSPLTITQQQAPALMEIYGLGFISIYLLFFGMYLHALKKANEIKLNRTEIFNCKTSIYRQLIMISIGLCSLIFAMMLSPGNFWMAGVIYILILPFLTILYTVRGKQKRQLLRNLVKA